MNLLVDIALEQPNLFSSLAQEFATDPQSEQAGIVTVPRFVWQGWTQRARDPDEEFAWRESRGHLGWWITGLGVEPDSDLVGIIPDDDSLEPNISILRSVLRPEGWVFARKQTPADGGDAAQATPRIFDVVADLRDRGTAEAADECSPTPSSDGCLNSGRCDKRCREYWRSIGRGDELHCLCV